jgi:hypothetical protein
VFVPGKPFKPSIMYVVDDSKIAGNGVCHVVNQLKIEGLCCK